MNSGKVILGLLAGLAVGATLGILFAPDKGTTTRKKISKKSRGYVNDVEHKFNDFVDGVSKQYEAVKEETARLIKTGKDKAEELKGDVKS
ncbi:MAG: YtxH domain-containing protein [Saprospiraceae bacterium]